MSDTTKTESTAPATEPTNPAPAATAVAEKTPAPAANTAAAPESKTPPPAEPQKPIDPKEVARSFYKDRQEKKVEKKATERVAELEQEIARLKAQPSNTPKAEEPNKKPSLLDDPEGYERYVLENATKNARESIAAELQQYEQTVARERATMEAADFLLTRSHLKEDPALLTPVTELVNTELKHIREVDPKLAAEMAYIRVCQSKGIVPDLKGFTPGNLNAANGATSTGVKPSAAAPGGEKIWTRAEIKAYKAGIDVSKDPAGYRARVDEVQKAIREGRVKD